MACSVLGIIGNLLEGAPRGWVALLGEQFIDNGESGTSVTSRLIPYISGSNEESELLSRSAVFVLAELIGHMSPVVFCDPIGHNRNDTATVAFLQSLGAAISSAMATLARTRIVTTSVETAEIIFQSFVNFLKLKSQKKRCKVIVKRSSCWRVVVLGLRAPRPFRPRAYGPRVLRAPRPTGPTASGPRGLSGRGPEGPT